MKEDSESEIERLIKGKCELCTSTSRLTLHHIDPRKEENLKDLNNLITLCFHCKVRIEDGVPLCPGDNTTIKEMLRFVYFENPRTMALLEDYVRILQNRGINCKLTYTLLEIDPDEGWYCDYCGSSSTLVFFFSFLP